MRWEGRDRKEDESTVGVQHQPLWLASDRCRLALPRAAKHWSLATLRERPIKIGAKVVAHARYVIFQMVGAAVPKRVFRAILERIQRLRLPKTMSG